MIQKNKQPNRPLYREIVRDAFFAAWSDRKLWIFAVFAAILQTGGVYDILLVSIKRMPEQVRTLLQGQSLQALLSVESRWSGLTAFESVLAYLSFVQGLFLISLIILSFWSLSAIAQGALTYGFGMRIRGKTPNFRMCLAAGANYLWPILALNVFSLGIIWIARFFVLVPFAFSLQSPSLLSVLAYLLSFLLFLIIAIAITAVHLFALNAIVLEKTHLWPAICQAYDMVKRSWILVLEIGAILFAVGALALLAGVALFVIAAVPLFLFMIAAALLQLWTFLWIALALGFVLFFAIMISFGAWAVAFQYAAWQQLYKRVSVGTAFAKVVRWIRWLVGHAT